MLLIPSTFTGEKRDQKIRIFLISQLARAIVNFRINEVGIYYDPDPKFNSHALGRFILKILKYLNTPPYLRKVAFPKSNDFKEIGVSLPITAEYHTKKDPYTYVYILRRGLSNIYFTDGDTTYSIKSKIKLGKNRIFLYDKENNKLIKISNAKIYMGYDVFYFNKPFHVLSKRLKRRGYYIIGTSRQGYDIKLVNIPNVNKIAIAFGSFARGFEDMYNNYKKFFDIVVNTVPDQNLKTIRTEEAVYYTLSSLRCRGII